MHTPDTDDLSELLRRWPGIEARATFEQDLLRRLRLEAGRPAAGGAAWAWLPARLGASPLRLAWAAGIPLVLALLAGVASVRVSPPPGTQQSALYGGFSLLERATVAGGYVALKEARAP